jgi:hypothetical protein
MPKRKSTVQLLSADHWERTLGALGAPKVGVETADRERVLAAINLLRANDDVGPLMLSHGDAHVANTYISSDGRFGWLDWQCLCFAPNFYDVATFMCGALSTADRRAHERTLLKHYLEALDAAGGPRITLDEAWQSYVQHLVPGIHWALIPTVMQNIDNIVTMATRYIIAIDDHASITAVLDT